MFTLYLMQFFMQMCRLRLFPYINILIIYYGVYSTCHNYWHQCILKANPLDSKHHKLEVLSFLNFRILPFQVNPYHMRIVAWIWHSGPIKENLKMLLYYGDIKTLQINRIIFLIHFMITQYKENSLNKYNSINYQIYTYYVKNMLISIRVLHIILGKKL